MMQEINLEKYKYKIKLAVNRLGEFTDLIVQIYIICKNLIYWIK